MTIICTEREKARMIETIVASMNCPMVEECKAESCKDCAEIAIKWMVVDKHE